jgi:23S rRNA maturation-related 3'-5' exoribonuclease YhaM
MAGTKVLGINENDGSINGDLIEAIVQDGEILCDAGKGVCLISPDSKKWRLKVDNSGVLSTEEVT